MNKKRILSGIKSSGVLTLGNYLGAMRRWANEQDNYHNFYFIPDLHVLNMRSMQENPTAVTDLTKQATAWLLACGVDPQKSVIYTQSKVPQHSELSWILENYTYYGELSRMTQFKDKVKTNETDEEKKINDFLAHHSDADSKLGQALTEAGLRLEVEKKAIDAVPAALFTYPVLMAADILLYDIDEVPVGDDQKQHVELTRKIANRFNNLYGDTFKLPHATVQATGARIMNLANPLKKMSKSDTDDSGNILLSDTPDTIKKKFKRAVTDSENSVTDNPDQAGVYNLLSIAAVLENTDVTSMAKRYQETSYGELKEQVAEAVIDELAPVQKRYQELISSSTELQDVLASGSNQAREIANEKLSTVQNKIGLL